MNVEPIPLEEQKRLGFSFFDYNLTDVLNSFPDGATAQPEEIADYVSMLNDEQRMVASKILSPVQQRKYDDFRSRYFINYLEKGGSPRDILTNAVRFSLLPNKEKFSETNRHRKWAYDAVIAYTFKRYPWYAAYHLVDFALETLDLQEKKMALAIVKSYEMLHIVKDHKGLLQRIIRNKEARKLFLSYGLNRLVKQLDYKFARFNKEYNNYYREEIKSEHITQCYSALLKSLTIGDFRQFEELVLDMQKLHKIDGWLDQKSYTEAETHTLLAQKPLLNPKSHPIFLEILLDRKKAKKNDKIFNLLEESHDEMKFNAGIIGIATYFSTLFTETLYECECFDYSRGDSDGVRFAFFLDALAIFCTVYNLNKDIEYMQKIDLQKQVNYIQGYLRGLIGGYGYKSAILPTEQEEKYKNVVNQKRDFFTIFSCSALTLAWMAIVKKIGLDAGLGRLVFIFNSFIGMPFLSFLLARWLQEVHYKNAKDGAKKLFESCFERGQLNGFAVFKKNLPLQDRVEKSEQEAVEEPSSLKAFFGVVKTFSKNLFEGFVQRIRRIEIRRPGPY